MSALSRTMLRLAYGLPADPADAAELGRIFDATELHGATTPPTDTASAAGGGDRG